MADQVRRVAVTGAAGYVGAGLVRRLEREAQVEGMLAIDVREPAEPFGPKVTSLRRDVLSSLGGVFSEHGVQAVAHLAYVVKAGHRRRAARRVNVDGIASVLAACEEAAVRRVVYLSSATVYGAHADNAERLTEGVTPRPIEGFPYSEDKLEAERLVLEFASRNPSSEATILRACPVLGPRADNDVAGGYLKPFLVGALGHDPPMQFLHEQDMSEVLARCVLRPAPGVYNVAGDGAIRWSEAARLLGRPLIKLPWLVLYTLTAAAWALRIQSDSPAAGLNLVRYPWTVSTEKARRELRVRFRHTSRETWQTFAEAVRRKR